MLTVTLTTMRREERDVVDDDDDDDVTITLAVKESGDMVDDKVNR